MTSLLYIDRSEPWTMIMVTRSQRILCRIWCMATVNARFLSARPTHHCGNIVASSEVRSGLLASDFTDRPTANRTLGLVRLLPTWIPRYKNSRHHVPHTITTTFDVTGTFYVLSCHNSPDCSFSSSSACYMPLAHNGLFHWISLFYDFFAFLPCVVCAVHGVHDAASTGKKWYSV